MRITRTALTLGSVAVLLAACAGPAGSDVTAASSAVPSPVTSSQPPIPTTSPEPAITASIPPVTTLSSPPTTESSTLEPAAPPRDPTLDQPLRDAAWANDVPRAAELIAAGADVNAKDDTQQSAYLIATSEGYLDLLELTLAHGADLTSLDSYRGTGLIRAGERGHADIVGRLLRAGIDTNHVNRPGWTALDEAIVYGDGSPSYVDTVRALIAGGADLDRVASDGRTPPQNAVRQGQDAVVLALTAGTQPPPADPATALLSAAADGDADAAAAALRAGAPIESRDAGGRTPLVLAATNDHVEVARLLVVLGADPDAQDDRRDSAWLVTGVTGSVAMLETLLPADPDLTLTNRFGGVSVIPASERGHVDYVRRVVQTGIDVNHINDPGWTALLEAIVYGDGSAPYREIVDILLTAGADPRIADAQGVTPLQHARSRGQDEIAQRLAAAGG
ncbi:ankyrin repeat domain-containing protein [Nakamurella sp.]|uniref:ankyrin repeat domain-containing protein n=1 Tax=Nakamurella sp. TaxID=1869182 RepID=UPI003782FB87